MRSIFFGIVIKGKEYGRKIGFPTINISFKDKNYSLPRRGVYSGFVFIGRKKYKAGVVVGPGKKIEAHLIGFNGDLYGEKVKIEISTFIRDYKKFSNEEDLKKEIRSDIDLITNYIKF